MNEFPHLRDDDAVGTEAEPVDAVGLQARLVTSAVILLAALAAGLGDWLLYIGQRARATITISQTLLWWDTLSGGAFGILFAVALGVLCVHLFMAHADTAPLTDEVILGLASYSAAFAVGGLLGWTALYQRP